MIVDKCNGLHQQKPKTLFINQTKSDKESDKETDKNYKETDKDRIKNFEKESVMERGEENGYGDGVS